MKIKICNIDNEIKFIIKNYCTQKLFDYNEIIDDIEININKYKDVNLFLEKFQYLKNNIKTEFCFFNDLELSNYKTNNNINYMTKIYNIPQMYINEPKVISIISFDGGIHGEFDNNGIMTSGDCINYWKTIGLTKETMPTVMLRTTNEMISNLNCTAQNSLNIQTIGSICKSSNLLIVLYVFINDKNYISNNLQLVMNDNIVYKGINLRTNNILITWGIPEKFLNKNDFDKFNNTCKRANDLKINIYSSCSYTDNSVNFPASCPYVIACGSTIKNELETYYSNSGYGNSIGFNKLDYQNRTKGQFRSIPDLVCMSDNNNSIPILVNNKYYSASGPALSASFYAGIFTLFDINENINKLIYEISEDSFNLLNNLAENNYDIKTGLGSINGNKFINNLKNKKKYNSLSNNVILDNNIVLENINKIQNEVSSSNIKTIEINENNIKITNLIVPSVINIVVGQIILITPTIIPNHASNKELLWCLENDNIIDFDLENNSITGLKEGTTHIKVLTKDGSNIEETIIVNVSSNDVKVKGISFDDNVVYIIRGGKQILTPNIYPSNALNTNITYKTGNLSIATVNNEGVVRGLNTGTTYINAFTQDGNFKASIKVNIVYPIKNLKITTKVKTLKVGKMLKLFIDYNPKISNPILKWESNNEYVLSVSKTGIITALEEGEAIITCTDIITGISANCKFNIVN